MARLKSHPVFFALLLLLGLAALAGLWLLYSGWSALSAGEKKLETARAELRRELSARPSPTPESTPLLQKDLDRTNAALAKMKADLGGSGETARALRAEKIPGDAVKMFFDISSFVDATRKKAAAAGVSLRPGEQFGFAAYANTFPDDRGLIAPVFLQRQVVKYLLDALIAARPAALLSVRRAPVGSEAAARPQPQRQAAGGGADDFFAIDPAITAAVPGSVEASAFRLSFEGDTECIRKFMNTVAAFELPLVVRGVEVEPVEPGKSAATGPASLAAAFGAAPKPAAAQPGKPVPIVGKTLSRFTVTIELIRLVEPAAKDGAPAS
ncbi:MAG: Amuc_1100 family pilus-like protein [Opitutaceae bacterium]|jgi:hypothetical protein|nr:Amuc_1100 family pilus-like protein [Opitutaceae bacterium]